MAIDEDLLTVAGARLAVESEAVRALADSVDETFVTAASKASET